MSQENLVKLKCTKEGHITYWTRKNKKVHKDKLELMKYCPTCRKHVLHIETKW